MIISIAGYKGAGKSTFRGILSNLIVEEGYNPIHLSFADPIKEVTKHIFGFSDEQVYGELKDIIDESWGFTPRSTQLSLGTEWGRDMVHSDIWVKVLEKRAQEFKDDIDTWVIVDDLRFENEAVMLKALGSTLIRIQTNRVSQDTSHRTETALDSWTDWDYIVENDGSLDDLRSSGLVIIDGILTELGKPVNQASYALDKIK